ncbi:hypothetical protein HDU78_006694 [Chytriomyces hyalinus]|nr:hypothetical protein HDU78_006694 [Chytriomyces hyalinus]
MARRWHDRPDARSKSFDAGMTAQMLAARVFDGTQEVDAAASEDVETRTMGSSSLTLLIHRPGKQRICGSHHFMRASPALVKAWTFVQAQTPQSQVAIPATGPQLDLNCPLNRHLNRLLSREAASPMLPLIEYTRFESPESLRFDDGCNSMTTMEVPDSMDLALACVYPDRVNPAQAKFPDTLQTNWAFRGCAVQKFHQSILPVSDAAQFWSCDNIKNLSGTFVKIRYNELARKSEADVDLRMQFIQLKQPEPEDAKKSVNLNPLHLGPPNIIFAPTAVLAGKVQPPAELVTHTVEAGTVSQPKIVYTQS